MSIFKIVSLSTVSIYMSSVSPVESYIICVSTSRTERLAIRSASLLSKYKVVKAAMAMIVDRMIDAQTNIRKLRYS